MGPGGIASPKTLSHFEFNRADGAVDAVRSAYRNAKQMLSVSNVEMRYGSKVLFEDVSVTFTPGRRYGLTGPNGSGKSTFMKVLTGELEAQKGTVVRPRKLRPSRSRAQR